MAAAAPSIRQTTASVSPAYSSTGVNVGPMVTLFFALTPFGIRCCSGPPASPTLTWERNLASLRARKWLLILFD